MQIGKKVVIIGVSASGKSTFARNFAKITGLPLIHMDSIWWKSGWVTVSDEEATKVLNLISSRENWIIEGYIPHGARLDLLERADLILYLDYSPLIASFRYIKRWWMHHKSARPELEGSPDVFSLKFLKLVWSKGEVISLDTLLDTISNKEKIIKFVSPKQAEDFLSNLQNRT